jgi:hypothetical protein
MLRVHYFRKAVELEFYRSRRALEIAKLHYQHAVPKQLADELLFFAIRE